MSIVYINCGEDIFIFLDADYNGDILNNEAKKHFIKWWYEHK